MGREQGRRKGALPPWPSSAGNACLHFADAVANEAGGERTRGLLNRPGVPAKGRLRALLPHRAVPLPAAARVPPKGGESDKTRRQRPVKGRGREQKRGCLDAYTLRATWGVAKRPRRQGAASP